MAWTHPLSLNLYMFILQPTSFAVPKAISTHLSLSLPLSFSLLPSCCTVHNCSLSSSSRTFYLSLSSRSHFCCVNSVLFLMAAALVFMLLLLSITGHSSATWCVCKEGSDTVLQKTLDYACGAGADCGPTHQNGPCFNPNTVRAHCSYAVNSYFQRNRQLPTACDFAGTATIVTSDPSVAGCMYPASASVSSTTPVNGGRGTPITTMPNGGSTTGSPVVTTPNTGVLGGAGTGLGPSGINNDISDGGVTLPKSITILSSAILTFSALVFW